LKCCGTRWHGLWHGPLKPLEQAKPGALKPSCKAVYTSSILVGAFLTARGRGELGSLGPEVNVTSFPAVKARRLLWILERKPLGYRVVRQSGSHRRLVSEGRNSFTFAFHDRATVPGHLVRKILIKDVGLSEREARQLL
jgi:predicted RNA binding protein YcfA (HicA-like mRNA interferase family)